MMIFLAYFKEKNHFQFRQVGFVLNNYTWDIGYNEFSNNILIFSGFIHQKV